MHILYIDHYAGSLQYGMEFRPYYLAKEWIKQGHQVTIIGANYSHLRNQQPQIKEDLESENNDGIIYLWLKTPRYQGSGIKRIANMLIFVFKLFKYQKKIIEQTSPDIVIASSTYPLDVYPAYSIAKRNKAKLVFELHDMWPSSPMLIGGYSKYHPFIWLMQRAENFACKNCDFYVSLLGNAKDYLVQHGLQKEKFIHVPNGFSMEELDLGSADLTYEHQSSLTKLRNEGKLIIGYAGGHAPSNALKSLVLAAKDVKKDNKVAFVLVGNGTQKEELMQMASDNHLSNVHFLPSIAKASIPILLSQFDILYAGGTRSILHSYGTSYNKITDYMLAEKPIIFAVDEPNSLVEIVGCGIQIPAEDEGELINTIQFLSKLSEEQRNEMGRKGREYALEKLNYTSLAKNFIDAINKY